jgi:hypothetical protein
LLLVAACGDDDPTPGETRAEQVRDAGLPDEVAEVVALAAASIDATYRVTYEVEGRTITVTQRPPDRRVDTAHPDGSEDSTVTVDGRTHACSRPPDGDWTCEDLGDADDAGRFDAAAVDDFVAAVEGEDLEVTERELLGVDARCLRTAPTPATLCVAPTGAILLVERPAGTVRATAYTTDVAGDAFVLPG